MSELLFSPAAILDLLSQIDELKNYNIGVSETLDNKIQITIGESVYEIDNSNATSIEIDEHSVKQIEEANMDAYDELSDKGEIELSTVESGILKEIAKTLLVGGLVRFTGKLLK